MQRISVTGNSGSGKSTFAVRLGRALDLPVIHLDRLYWRAPGERVPPDEFVAKVDEALSEERWIVEGYDVETFHQRAARADAVIFMDTARWRCVWRLAVRGRRIGVPDGGAPRWRAWRQELRFLRWVWIFPTDRRPYVLQDLDQHGRKVHTLRTPRQARRFIAAARRARSGTAAG